MHHNSNIDMRSQLCLGMTVVFEQVDLFLILLRHLKIHIFHPHFHTVYIGVKLKELECLWRTILKLEVSIPEKREQSDIVLLVLFRKHRNLRCFRIIIATDQRRKGLF